MMQTIMPMGVLLFCHPEIGHVERVPYATEEEFITAFSEALDKGFDPECLETHVRMDRQDVAQKIADIMVEKTKKRYPIYLLEAANLNFVLGDHTIIIPTTKVG